MQASLLLALPYRVGHGTAVPDPTQCARCWRSRPASSAKKLDDDHQAVVLAHMITTGRRLLSREVFRNAPAPVPSGSPRSVTEHRPRPGISAIHPTC